MYHLVLDRDGIIVSPDGNRPSPVVDRDGIIVSPDGNRLSSVLDRDGIIVSPDGNSPFPDFGQGWNTTVVT